MEPSMEIINLKYKYQNRQYEMRYFIKCSDSPVNFVSSMKSNTSDTRGFLSFNSSQDFHISWQFDTSEKMH